MGMLTRSNRSARHDRQQGVQ